MNSPLSTPILDALISIGAIALDKTQEGIAALAKHDTPQELYKSPRDKRKFLESLYLISRARSLEQKLQKLLDSEDEDYRKFALKQLQEWNKSLTA